MNRLILAINPGNSSTKLGLFREEECIREENLHHPDTELAAFPRISEQYAFRAQMVSRFLENAGVKKGELAAVVGRGGLLKPIPSGTFTVNSLMLEDLQKAGRGEHASNLGAPIAQQIAEEHGCRAFIVDPVAVDEMEDVARYTGLKGVERQSLSHALNMKAVAKRFAKATGKDYKTLRLIVAHMGSGSSLSAHAEGRMVDVINPKDEGPMSGDRAGSVPSSALVDLCFKAGADIKQIKKQLFGEGGLYALLGTRDVRDAIARAKNGEAEAKGVLDAMCYQVAKYIGEMAVVLEGKVDAILLTGGMAYNAPITDPIRARTEWIAPVQVYPGEDELKALCEGALRVLNGEETAKEYR